MKKLFIKVGIKKSLIYPIFVGMASIHIFLTIMQISKKK